jgi:pimeloyl-ACP methyl ester carboxylesterase
MAAKTTVSVPHLGGIDAGYRVSGSGIDASKPTLVLVNSMCTTSSLFEPQFAAKDLTDAVNLLAIEPLGHGATSTKSEHFTYWDSAIMNLQVMEALGVKKAFALGTSAGGWVATRMALLAPEKVRFPVMIQSHATPREAKATGHFAYPIQFNPPTPWLTQFRVE